jgi:hypothetical protein
MPHPEEPMKEEEKHTPAPWMVRGEPDLVCVTDSSSAYIVDRFILGDRPKDEHLANAYLIAAAPWLLAALKRMVKENVDTPGHVVRQAEAAIAAAQPHAQASKQSEEM